jgi:FlaA1/EpsC-like NDP-sugar epimerase
MAIRDHDHANTSPATTDGGGLTSVLVTGATGYVGGRLLRRLEAQGRHRVRCLTRRPEALAGAHG